MKRPAGQAAVLAVGLLLIGASVISARELNSKDDARRSTGLSHEGRRLKVAGGKAPTRQYPYYVSIRDFDTKRDGPTGQGQSFPGQLNSVFPRHLCGGVMVQPLPSTSGNDKWASSYQFVLTAASCIENNPNPMVIVGANRDDYGIGGTNSAPDWANLANSARPWPARTTYASYKYPGYTRPGADFDFAVLVLDQQATPNAQGQCQNCAFLAGARPAPGPKNPFTAVGLGSNSGGANFNPSAQLRDAVFTILDWQTCRTLRDEPTVNPFKKRFWKQRFGTQLTITDANSLCATSGIAGSAAPTPAGMCNMDAGNPLIQVGNTPAADRIVGIAAKVSQSCDSSADPQIYTDVTRVADWVQGIMKSVTPKLDANNAQIESGIVQPNPPVPVPIKTVYSYSMRITFVNPGTQPGVSKPTPLMCGFANQGDTKGVITLGGTGGPIARSISSELLQKNYFPAVPGQYNPVGVLPASCKDTPDGAEVKFEWSSGRKRQLMNQQLTAAFTPLNDNTFAAGLKYWLMAWRTYSNVEGAVAISKVKVETGRGPFKKPVWPSMTQDVAQNVDLTGWDPSDPGDEIRFDEWYAANALTWGNQK